MGGIMTKKQQTLEALHEWIIGFEDKTVTVGSAEDCVFCWIHNDNIEQPGYMKQRNEFNNIDPCKGCPFTDESMGDGCHMFHVYQSTMYGVYHPDYVGDLNAMLLILSRISQQRFTKRGWRYFKELDEYRAKPL